MISEETLEQAFKREVRDACDGLAAMCFDRIMKDPENGLKFLSTLATYLDCKIVISFELGEAPLLTLLSALILGTARAADGAGL